MGNIVNLELILQDNIRTVTITKEEHSRFSQQLKADMPVNWNCDDDWLVRYKSANIEIFEKLPDDSLRKLQ